MIEQLPDYPALCEIQRALWHDSEIRGAAVMVGSGFSTNAQLASPSSRRPPLWSDMADGMVRRLGGQSSGSTNPLRLAEEFRALLGQSALDSLVRDYVRDDEWLPGELHRALVRLPWSEILTTNWDTLIERAAADEIDRPYELVLTPKDIARTRSPRVVKLHGSLPSHTPFIFAEEDYRRYPNDFAPFVNLARHVLLENELLLLGFSGDDPNFLAWTGWVRDQLGNSARPVRLAGVLNLTPARRRYLENLNVTPIDLASLVENIPDQARKHTRAAELLLESLKRAKPVPLHVWTRQDHFDQGGWLERDNAKRLGEETSRWQSERENAPDWLVAPHLDRSRLRMTIEEEIPALNDLLGDGNAAHGGAIAELAWRLRTAHFGVPDWAHDHFERAILAPDDGSMDKAVRVEILAQLTHQAIEDQDGAAVERWLAALRDISDEETDVGPQHAYLTSLWARDRFDLATIAEQIDKITGADPVWAFRRAGLYCTLCQPDKAAPIVREALADIRRRRSRDRKSLWLLSREGWALWLARHFRFEKDDPEDDADEAEWPHSFRIARCDPWEEFESFEHDLVNEAERSRSFARTGAALFEPGSWTNERDKRGGYIASWVLPSELQLRRLADWIGIPHRFGSFQGIAPRLERSLMNSDTKSPAQIRRVATYIESYDKGLINSWFGRLNVAALPAEIVDDLVEGLHKGIDFLWSAAEAADEWEGTRLERIRTLIELLSRLIVRVDEAQARIFFVYGLKLIKSKVARHWWLHRPLRNLLRRSLSAIPPATRGDMTQLMIDLPLPGEQPIAGSEHDWPELADLFEWEAVTISRPAVEWDARIAELISFAKGLKTAVRNGAITRLKLLSEKGLLSDAETQDFALSIWSRRNGLEGLPSDTNYYPGAFLMMPEPSEGLAEAAFRHEIIVPMEEGRDVFGGKESLSFLGQALHRGEAGFRVTAAEAGAIFDALSKANRDADSDEAFAFAIANGLLPVLELTEARREALLERARRPDAVHAVIYLPFLAMIDPALRPEVISRLRRAMNSRSYETVNPGLLAVERWAKDAKPSQFPAELAADVAALCATRREPGLFLALDVARKLLGREQLAPADKLRLVDGLAALGEETDYSEWQEGDIRTSTLTYVRANAFRLAASLAPEFPSDPGIVFWLDAGARDPVPEVRYAPDHP
jgi:hypothetical protein